MSLPYSSSSPALAKEKGLECGQIWLAIKKLMLADIKPKDIMTKQAFENAITLIMTLGGSTNAVIHLIAMAKAVDVALNINDFQRISDKTPFIADLKPSGKFLFEDLHDVGGIPGLMRYLLKEGFLEGNCLTVTGKTLGENLEEVTDLAKGQKIIRPIGEPIQKHGHIQILYGNLAEEGAVAKITGKEAELFTVPAIVFEDEFEDEFEAVKGIQSKVSKGDVIVIRHSGPKGAPGMPEMLKPTSVVMGAKLGKDVALITDGRFSGGSHGFVVGLLLLKPLKVD